MENKTLIEIRDLLQEIANNQTSISYSDIDILLTPIHDELVKIRKEIKTIQVQLDR